MSGIYIPGMETPKEGDLIVIRPDWKAYYVSANPQNAYEGKAIPVPEHGRLIDADALSEEHRKRAYETNGSSYQFHITAKAWVDEAPTIIPADKEETE